jgi:putative membrane protein
MLRRLLWHWLVLAFGLYLLSLIPFLGITYQRPSNLVWAALILIFAQTFIRPILIFFTFPLVIVTLGLFLLVINAVILKMIPHFVHGFQVPTFGSAFIGALLLSLVSAVFLGWERRRPRRWRKETRGPLIDI